MTSEAMKKFLKSAEVNSIELAKLADQLDSDDCIICFVQKGRIQFGSEVDDGHRIEQTYSYDGEKVFKSRSVTVREEITA